MKQSSKLLQETERSIHGSEDPTKYAVKWSNEKIDLNVDVALPVNKASKLPIFAILLNLASAGAIIGFTLRPVYVPQLDTIDSANSAQVVYLTGITLLATIVAAVTTGQIRQLWLRFLLERGHKSARVTRQKRNLLGIGRSSENVRAWPITLSFIIASLIVTALVTGLNPGNRLVSKDYVLQGQNGTADIVLSRYGYNLANTCLNDSSSPKGLFNWQVDDGKYVNVLSNPLCPSFLMSRYLSLVHPLPYEIRYPYAYSLQSTLVTSAAAGVPFYGMLPLRGFEQIFGLNFRSSLTALRVASRCLPVLVRNPVRCEAAGSVEVVGNNLTVTAGNCTVSRPVYAVDPLSESAAVGGVCSDQNPVGKNAIVLGATNAYADYLRSSIDPGPRDLPGNSKTSVGLYSVACSVDMSGAIGWRTVTYSRVDVRLNQTKTNPAFSGFQFVADAKDDECVPDFPYAQYDDLPGYQSILLANDTLAIGASAALPLLMENMYLDGWWPSLHQLALSQEYIRGRQSVNNSTVPLENALGVATAMTLGFWWGGSHTAGSGSSSIVSVGSGSIASHAVAVGLGEPAVLVLALPSLICAALIAALLFATSMPKDRRDESILNRFRY